MRSDALKRALSRGRHSFGWLNSAGLLWHVKTMPRWNRATAGDEDRSPSKTWFLSPLITVIAGVSLSALVWSWVSADADHRAAVGFGEQARVLSAALFNRSQALEQGHRSLAMLLATVPNPTDEQFTLAARSILEPNTGFVAVAWAPLVKADGRDEWQKQASERVGRKIVICDRSPDGVWKSSETRPFHLPIAQVELASSIDLAPGLDLMMPVFDMIVTDAVRLGEIPLSALDTGIHGSNTGPLAFAVIPVYRGGKTPADEASRWSLLNGVLVVALSPMQTINAALDPGLTKEIDLLVGDISTKGVMTATHYRPAGMEWETNLPDLAEFAAGRIIATNIVHMTRDLQIPFLFRPSPRLTAQLRGPVSATGLTAGLSLTALLSGYLAMAGLKARRINDLVQRRTRELRLANGQLEERQWLLDKAQEVAGIGSWISEPDKDRLRWSTQTMRIFGHPVADFDGRMETFLDHVHPDDRDAIETARKRISEGSGPLDFRHRIIRRDGSVRWVEQQAQAIRASDGHVHRIIGVIRDITESLEQERQVQASQRELAGVINSVPGVVYRYEVRPDGTEGFTFASQHSMDLFLIPPGDIVRNPGVFDAMVFPEDKPRLVESREKSATELSPWREEFRVRLPDGQFRWIRGSSIPSQDAVTGILSWTGVFLDVTSERETMAESRKIERKMQDAQKLESLGVLAGGVAHDFNNLLTGVLGNASMARATLNPDPKLHEFLTTIENAARRAADLCRQLLAYAGRGSLQEMPMDMSKLVRETVDLLKVSVSKRAILEFDLADSLPAVSIDPTQIRQVVMNLVTNASDALGTRDGRIRVSTSLVCPNPDLVNRAVYSPDKVSGEFVCLEISDTGCGMSPQTRRKIFDPFFTTKFTGRGLGLAAVLGIARRHNAILQVESAEDEGSTFRLLIPPASHRTRLANEPAIDEDALTLTGNMLVVDDEPAVRQIVCKMLRSFGVEVVEAEDGEAALMEIGRASNQFSLVLLDITMPKLDGMETLPRIRAMNPTLPVVIMSGYAQSDTEFRRTKHKASGFLQKPFSVDELKTMIRSVL